jgi:hypothetical protein
MSELRGRLAALERAIGGPCQTCGGEGWDCVVVIEEDSGQPPPPQPTRHGCPECGRCRALRVEITE